MATIAIGHAFYLGNQNGQGPICRGGPEEPDLKETASQTYGIGAPLYKDSNGTIAIAAASSNIITELCGFALKAATGTTGAQVRYRPVIPGEMYVMSLQGTSTDATALTQVGNKYMLDIDTARCVVNVDATFDAAKPHVQVLKMYTAANGYSGVADAVGDTNGRVVVVFPDQTGIQGG